jgi:3-oxoacyl-[acyl-carrier protein] reductase
MANDRIDGCVALVTGASRGIGAALADALSKVGLKLLLVARNESRLRAVAGRLDGPVAVRSIDLTDPSAPAALVNAVVETYGRLDILINNAGIAERASFEQTDRDMLSRHLALNVQAPFHLTQACIPLLRRSNRPTVVNIGSVVAHHGYADQSAYSAGKHALLGWTKAAARELAGEDIRFHVVSPGGVATPMIEEVRPDLDVSTLMDPEDVAAAVVYLVTNRSNAVIDEVRIRRAGSEPFK